MVHLFLPRLMPKHVTSLRAGCTNTAPRPQRGNPCARGSTMPIRYRSQPAEFLDAYAAPRDNYDHHASWRSGDGAGRCDPRRRRLRACRRRHSERAVRSAWARESDRHGCGHALCGAVCARGQIVCHVVNYEAHATGVGPPSQPYFFTKPSSSVLDPRAPIQPHTHISKELDWETELAVVFGREARDVSESEAYDVICGLHDPE
jgi:2-keto-4-pentenoate hydratase/2-oxohepta-3-ene-1,7-dioic acid hydratase in catechol pathway